MLDRKGRESDYTKKKKDWAKSPDVWRESNKGEGARLKKKLGKNLT